MVFLKTDCVECGERILFDERNGYGYCMYCGAKVDSEGAEKFPSYLREILETELSSSMQVDGSWKESYEMFESYMACGDFLEATKVIQEVLDGDLGSEEVDNFRDKVIFDIMDWLSGGWKTLDRDIIGSISDLMNAVNGDEGADDDRETLLKLFLMSVAREEYGTKELIPVRFGLIMDVCRSLLDRTYGMDELNENINLVMSAMMSTAHIYDEVEDDDICAVEEESHEGSLMKVIVYLSMSLDGVNEAMDDRERERVDDALGGMRRNEVMRPLFDAIEVGSSADDAISSADAFLDGLLELTGPKRRSNPSARKTSKRSKR